MSEREIRSDDCSEMIASILFLYTFVRFNM